MSEKNTVYVIYNNESQLLNRNVILKSAVSSVIDNDKAVLYVQICEVQDFVSNKLVKL